MMIFECRAPENDMLTPARAIVLCSFAWSGRGDMRPVSLDASC